MLLDRLLKLGRPAAAPTRTRTQDELAAVARTHADPAQRREAVRELHSLALLREIAAEDADAAVREVAFGRYRGLLAGPEEAADPAPGPVKPRPGPRSAEPGAPRPTREVGASAPSVPAIPLAERLAELERTDDPRLVEHLAKEARDGELRRAAIERVGVPKVLVACVLNDPLAANRAAAVARLDDREALEQVVRGIGKKDKGVYRTAKERLRAIAEREALPLRIRAQCAELCERAERLGRLEAWTQDRALLEHLDRQWAEIESQAEPEWQTRWQALRERFLAGYEAWRAANAAELAAREAAAARHAAREALIAEAQNLKALTGERELVAERTRLAAAWESLETGDAGADGGDGVPGDTGQRQPAADLRPDPKQERRFAEALAVADAALGVIAEGRRQAVRLKKLAARAERLLAESRSLDLKALDELLAEGRALAAEPQDGGAEAGAFGELAERLQARAKTQRRHAEQRLAEMPERLAELEAALEAGELKRADPLHQSLQAALDLIRASGLASGAARDTADRLRALSPRLRELQHWRRFGADTHRQALCEAMERLVSEDMPLPAVAERLHVLQTDWKELDRSGSPANQGLWRRFHSAGEQVYARCRPHLEAEAAERDANRAAREAVCAQLENFLAHVDWERVDWRRVMRAEREVRQAWAAIGPCEQRVRHALDRRFHKSIKELDGRLEAERAANQAFKQDLIACIEALAERPDLDAAIEETKGLQRQWHTTVPARQRDENRLWQAFRAACDRVFERRAAEVRAHRAEQDEHIAVRDALVAEALTLAASQTDTAALAAARRDLERRWQDTESLPIPRQAGAALARRWGEARERLAARLGELEARERRAVLAAVAARAALCESVESRVLARGPDAEPAPGEAEAALGAWSDLPPLDDARLDATLRARLKTALDAAGNPARWRALAEASRANGERRCRLALELEIAAGLSSPPELSRERLRVQVARLAERLGEGEEDRLGGVPELLTQWHLCGPAPEDAALAARIARVAESAEPAPASAPASTATA